MEAIMAHYVAIIVPSGDGTLRVLFPDLSDCETHGVAMDDATIAATEALSHWLGKNADHLPPPRDLASIERDEEWLSKNDVDFSKAIVTMVSVIS
jgi:predicted RNase H-like HicB family nuclease